MCDITDALSIYYDSFSILFCLQYFTDRLRNGTDSSQPDPYMFDNMSVLLAQLPLLLFTLLNSFLYQQ